MFYHPEKFKKALFASVITNFEIADSNLPKKNFGKNTIS